MPRSSAHCARPSVEASPAAHVRPDHDRPAGRRVRSPPIPSRVRPCGRPRPSTEAWTSSRSDSHHLLTRSRGNVRVLSATQLGPSLFRGTNFAGFRLCPRTTLVRCHAGVDSDRPVADVWRRTPMTYQILGLLLFGRRDPSLMCTRPLSRAHPARVFVLDGSPRRGMTQSNGRTIDPAFGIAIHPSGIRMATVMNCKERSCSHGGKGPRLSAPSQGHRPPGGR